ncbi:hypothetical protein EJB05_19692, partial [Eragrostis curvula]
MKNTDPFQARGTDLPLKPPPITLTWGLHLRPNLQLSVGSSVAPQADDASSLRP